MKSDIEASPEPESTKHSSFSQLWNQSINPVYADWIGLVLCFVTGLCDSSAYNAWTCFLAMQTGSFLPSFIPTSNKSLLKQRRKHDLPRPWRLLPALQQTLGLAKIPCLHRRLLPRRNHLLQHHPYRRCPSPWNPLRLLPHPVHPHYHCRRAYRSRPYPAYLARR